MEDSYDLMNGPYRRKCWSAICIAKGNKKSDLYNLIVFKILCTSKRRGRCVPGTFLIYACMDKLGCTYMLFEDLYVSRFKIFFTIQVLNKKMLLIVIFFYNSEPLLSAFLIPWWWFKQGRIHLPDLNNHFFLSVNCTQGGWG